MMKRSFLCLSALIISSIFFLTSCETPAGTYINIREEGTKTITTTISLSITNTCDHVEVTENSADGSTTTVKQAICKWQRYTATSPQIKTATEENTSSTTYHDTIVISIPHKTTPNTLQDTYYFYLVSSLRLKQTQFFFYKQ